jgi:hypothetical protein
VPNQLQQASDVAVLARPATVATVATVATAARRDRTELITKVYEACLPPVRKHSRRHAEASSQRVRVFPGRLLSQNGDQVDARDNA